MAHAAAPIETTSGLRGKWNAFTASLGQGFNAYVESRSRISQIHKLNALSDAQLDQLGIKRDQIPHYVFRDLFYI